MPKFFIPEKPDCGIITVRGEDAVHIGRSLRSRPGDTLVFCREGIDYTAVIKDFTKDTVTCEVIEERPSAAEPRLRLSLYCALPKGDKAELIIQKCTELGAAEYVFFESSRCVAKFGGKEQQKTARYAKIAHEAAMQSGRGRVPEVRAMSLDEAVNALCSADIPLICYENSCKSSVRFADLGEKLKTANTAAVMIGAEGGFDRAEVEKAISGGAVPLWLGERILRCETAPIAVTAAIMAICGEM